MKVTGEQHEVRGDIRRPLETEVRALIELCGFACPDNLKVRYHFGDRTYVVSMAYGAAVHMFDVKAPVLSREERDVIFTSLASDDRVPIAQEL